MHTEPRTRSILLAAAIAAPALVAGCTDDGTPAAATDTQALFGWDTPRAEPAIPWDEMTPLQKHVSFFDYNGDGYITVLEDYRGLRALGIDPASSMP